MMEVLYPVTVLGGLGLLFGSSLSIASKIFSVEVDPKFEEIRAILPGANCGACGYPGCDGFANAVVEGKAPTSGCNVGGNEVAGKVANIMGVEAEEVDREVAVVLCQGDCDLAKDKYIYDGIKDCRVQDSLAGGSLACSYGCLGCGTCQEVCEFDAISIVNGIAEIDKDKCTGCTLCVDVCPRDVIEMVPYNNEVVVKCNSEDPGRLVRQQCDVGCIGCQICVRSCPADAFIFENNLAKIDYNLCVNCGVCAEKCPTNSIYTDFELRRAKAN